MNLALEGKLAVVTGGSRGIGLAIAAAFLESGAGVAAVARSPEALNAAAKRFDTPAFTTHVADVTDAISCERAFEEIARVRGGIDVLVANVGSGASVAPGAETPAEWQKMFAVNVLSATNAVASARSAMNGRNASIVCISSICGRETTGAPIAYSAAKAALDSFIGGIARPLAAESIRINGVAPGNVFVGGGTWDRKLTADPGGTAAMLEREVAMRRFGTPEEIADVVLFLASGRASFMTGSIVVVDGGQSRS